MYIGQKLLVKHEGKVQEGIVENIYLEDLDIRLNNRELISRKFWEVRKVDEKKE
jgi:hypothetical protein